MVDTAAFASVESSMARTGVLLAVCSGPIAFIVSARTDRCTGIGTAFITLAVSVCCLGVSFAAFCHQTA